ncbi:hypothetical protein EVAR_18883_1 [Eumeta japonica]|uniref:Uncharacterized protein n=1 Tax=Eumeta variegata TaxID=151549 RepID=A0A4C1V1R6_EUMVA|nr:hypothetical protein EVAR_18883_1 [Eumeta japonica]
MQHDISSDSSNLTAPNATSDTTEKPIESVSNTKAQPKMEFNKGSPAAAGSLTKTNRSYANDTNNRGLGNGWHSDVNLNATDMEADYVNRFSVLQKGRRVERPRSDGVVRAGKEAHVYGQESARKRSGVANGSAGEAANLKFRCGMHAREWTEVGRTMGMRVYVMVLGLLLLGLATCAAAPAHRAARNAHADNKYVVSFYFGSRLTPIFK